MHTETKQKQDVGAHSHLCYDTRKTLNTIHTIDCSQQAMSLQRFLSVLQIMLDLNMVTMSAIIRENNILPVIMGTMVDYTEINRKHNQSKTNNCKRMSDCMSN